MPAYYTDLILLLYVATILLCQEYAQFSTTLIVSSFTIVFFVWFLSSIMLFPSISFLLLILFLVFYANFFKCKFYTEFEDDRESITTYGNTQTRTALMHAQYVLHVCDLKQIV